MEFFWGVGGGGGGNDISLKNAPRFGPSLTTNRLKANAPVDSYKLLHKKQCRTLLTAAH